MSESIASADMSSAAGSVVRRARGTWKTAILATEAVVVYIALRLLIVGGPGAFPAAGRWRVGPGAPDELKVYPRLGYDGQFVYRLALDPFTTRVWAHGMKLDLPAYRQQRIMTALLGHVVAWLPGISTGVALIVVNGLAVVVAVVAGVWIADDLGRRAGWGWLLAVPACLSASLAADLTEPVAWAAVLVGLVAIRQGRWAWAAAAFTVAMLARETSAIVVAGLAIESIVLLIRSRFREDLARLWLAMPILIETAWQARLWQVWGTVPALSGLRNTGAGSPLHGTSRWPLVGILDNFFAPGRPGKAIDPVLAVSNVCERFVLAALLLAAGWALVTKRARPGLAITTGWSLAAALALSLRAWQTDIQFLRAAMEAWGLSILVLMTMPTRWATYTLVAGAVVTGWVAIYFLPRV
jgi:hypothetical protein